ncbi:hypothetical protein ABT354_10765 [Streptomyces sp. NPDC000594]|uniref:hypothetical protein n=1 Tax=Streptomyces sp. NPDC000594 TaxID=3154261 RepID=UPI00332D23D2
MTGSEPRGNTGGHPARNRRSLRAGGAVTAGLCAFMVWALWPDPTPYDLRSGTPDGLRIEAQRSEYPYSKELAADVDELLKVYVERLREGDARELARLGPPWYEGRYAHAVRLIERLGPVADEPVRVVVGDPVVPYFGVTRLNFADGVKQELRVIRDRDDVWWVELGEGDLSYGQELPV